MRLKYAVAAIALLSLPVGSAMADSFWRNVLSSGATTGSTYLTFKKTAKSSQLKMTPAVLSPVTDQFVARTWSRPCNECAPITRT